MPIPGIPQNIKIAWVARRLRIAVFPDGPTTWIAACTRSYLVAQGSTPMDAIRVLFRLCAENESLADSKDRGGDMVIRWRAARGASTHIAQMESKASLRGVILDGVDWRRSSPMYLRGSAWRKS